MISNREIMINYIEEGILKDIKTADLDKKIKQLRQLTRDTEDVEECWKRFEELDRLQRKRFDLTGKFLLCNNDTLYTFSKEELSWYAWTKEQLENAN